MEKLNQETQATKIRNFVRGFKATHLINIGGKLGIFQALYDAEDGMTSPELSAKLGLNEPYLGIWLRTAWHFDILDYDSSWRFKLQPFLDEILGDSSNEGNILGSIAISVDIQGDRFNKSPYYYRTGEIIQGYTRQRSDAVAEGTKGIFAAFLDAIPRREEHLKRTLEKGARFLDVGCGQGNLIIQLARKFEYSSFVGVDPVEYGIEQARRHASQLGLEERVSFENMGGQELPYADEFDMTCMTVVFHEIIPGVRDEMVKKVYRALKRGGLFLILDFMYPAKLEDFKNPVYEPGVVDQFDETCLGVVHLNPREQDELFEKVGFKNIRRTKITTLEGIELIIAEK